MKKKGRPPIVDSEDELINWYVNIYYRDLEKNQEIRQDEAKHIEMINTLNDTYLAQLKKGKNFNYEKYETAFIECIDFLTKVFTNKRLREEKGQRMREFMQSTKK